MPGAGSVPNRGFLVDPADARGYPAFAKSSGTCLSPGKLLICGPMQLCKRLDQVHACQRERELRLASRTKVVHRSAKREGGLSIDDARWAFECVERFRLDRVIHAHFATGDGGELPTLVSSGVQHRVGRAFAAA